MARILGIDPGSTASGWGVVQDTNGRLQFIAAGVIRPQRSLSRAEKLTHIFEEICALIEAWSPEAAAVEETFVNASPRDALVLGEARGVALMAPAFKGLSVTSYAANTVKKSVVGRGHAEKSQVQAMVKVLLPASGKQPADAADALAIAICHAHHHSSPANGSGSKGLGAKGSGVGRQARGVA
ncbi:MAG: crossover junction endodeoxyribonuclease RuvC [Pseudomonadota bacterium]